jgi:cytochrome c nitrite reductase small subunit
MKASHASIVAVAALLGAVLGLGTYTFAYARGWSYLSDAATACANCHVMNEQYDGWIKSSHRSVAVCNDCHVPHDVVGKYTTKARNGFWHSYYFTTGTFPEPIRATPRSRDIAEANCRRCHEAVVEAMGTPAVAGASSISCVRCHVSVGHMELLSTNVASNATTAHEMNDDRS